jgi:branched-subunit amino acid aminotransferase/4-amino-4-deoxychorismate lyase
MAVEPVSFCNEILLQQRAEIDANSKQIAWKYFISIRVDNNRTIRTLKMHKVASLNGKIISEEQVCLPVLSAAAIYGRGVFTTIAIADSQPFLLEKHWRRLNSNAVKLGIDISRAATETIEIWLFDLLKANSVVNGRARITLFDAGGSVVWTEGSEKRTDVLINTGHKREVADKPRLTISPFPLNSRSPLAGIKSCNYLDHLMAYEDARHRGYDEAIRTNERGEITSACMANVFWLSGGRMFTPDIETGCIPGTTREYILENIECDEVCANVDELMSAEGVFISSAGIGVKAVRSIDDKVFGNVDHDILRLLPPKTKTRMSAK